jgi:hypothetical protein
LKQIPIFSNFKKGDYAMFKTSISVFILGIILSISVFAQSQALNGQIEGTVSDANGASVPNASVTAKNIETGTERKTVSAENGTYRIPLLPLGTYQIIVEAANFKKYVREGITLTTGQTATIDVALQAGGLTETVTIQADAPIVDPGKSNRCKSSCFT